MIEELREQAQAIRAEGGEQMLADLLCRAADALEAERKAREEANSAYDVINRAWKEMKERAEAAEGKLENLRKVVAAAKQLRKEFGSESDRGVCRVFDAAIDAARKERK